MKPDKLKELKLMVKVFIACMETGLIPRLGSKCHKKALELVESKRKRLS